MQEYVFTVSLLTQAIQELLEAEFPIVHVVGEISNYKRHQSGHRYFILKDASAQIRCVLWRGRPVPFELTDGMQVRVRGKVTVYPLQGTYQIDCFAIIPAGIGDLYAAFEQLKRELAAAGYFDPSRKRPLPRFPERIGIATSPTGAALHDMLTTLERRNPAITVVFRPTLVQGAEAAADIATAIQELERAGCDVIIVGRGGGSIEDLWAFNTRTVADSIYNARVPVVSAVGHETDVTIADFVADVRAATPTAAAELCSPIRREDLYFYLDQWAETVSSMLSNALDAIDSTLKHFASPATVSLLARHVEHLQYRLDSVTTSYQRAIEHTIEIFSQRIQEHASMLEVLHPLTPLQRGFALIERDGLFIQTTDQTTPGDIVRIHRITEIATATIVESNHTAEKKSLWQRKH